MPSSVVRLITKAQAVSSIIVILFFIWILPLGFFIKPAQEKIVCNGQRPICLCSHRMSKPAAQNAGKAINKGSGATQKEQSVPGGASYHFLTAQKMNQTNQQISFCHQEENSLYSLLVFRPIEPVPKV